ncbi:hypothetical protein C8J36_11121 [Rhizobium sp. PP-F2F-G48]|nr:hypothetical protein C8J36_11121 [Rhizobium sp. PP-F2F-G48]
MGRKREAGIEKGSRQGVVREPLGHCQPPRAVSSGKGHQGPVDLTFTPTRLARRPPSRRDRGVRDASTMPVEMVESEERGTDKASTGHRRPTLTGLGSGTMQQVASIVGNRHDVLPSDLLNDGGQIARLSRGGLR